jgi:4-amino-4-deoxy-L-arabinose transferase-like glycosyltransferase
MSDVPRDDWHPEPLDALDWCLGLAITAGTLAVLMWTSQMGFPRDESFYFHAAGEYIGWFEELWKHYQAGELEASFTKSNIDEHWSYNSEHPVLMKTLFALSLKLFAHTLGWLEPSLAMRIPGAATGALTVGIVYLFGRQVFGRLAGLVGAGALLFQPRFFFHAHLACFDVPITMFWLATAYAYWRSYDSGGWAVATGLFFGFALCTKLNAFFLPIVFGGHWLATHWTSFGLVRTDRGTQARLPSLPTAFLWMALLGPLVFYALTPRFWFDTFQRVQSYMAFHLNHVHYFVYYFGENLQHPPLPISYPWVMTLVTVPATILLAAALGALQATRTWDLKSWVERWRRAWRSGEIPRNRAGDPRGTGLFLAINLLFPIALISMPDTPIFGGTKHWMPGMPFLAIFAGGGALLASRAVRDWWNTHRERAVPTSLRVTVAALLGASILAPAVYGTAHVHPFGTSYYNELIGSVRGAADNRMFRQFWGYASREGFPWLNEHAEQNAEVWTHNTTGYAWWHYQEEGDVRSDLRRTGMKQSQYALYHHQKAFVYQRTKLWQRYDTFTPEHVVSLEGVPMLSIYAR